MTINPIDILIVCTGNICRSPMAEGLLKQAVFPKWKDRFHVHSAGTFGLTGNRAEQNAVRALHQLGIDIRDHRARSVDRSMIGAADMIIVMEEMHRDFIVGLQPEATSKVWLLSVFGEPGGPVDVADPYGGSLERYTACALFMKVRMACFFCYLEETVCKQPGYPGASGA